MIENCVAEQNGFEGFSANYETRIINCVATANRWGIGISGKSNFVYGNCLTINNEKGIRCENNNNRIEGNHIAGSDYDSGIGISIEDSAEGNLIIKNSVTGYQSAYSISSGNAYGPIIDVSSGGDLAAISGAEHPWSNFQY